MTYHDLIDKINKGEQFSFVRFGDGEWCAMYDLPHTSLMIKRHKQGSLDFCRKYMRQMVEQPQPYIRGVQQLAKNNYPQIHQYIGGFVNADILHHMSQEVGITPLLNALKGKRCLLVGPEYLTPMGWDMVFTAMNNEPWVEYESIKDAIASKISNYDVVMYSCTFLGKVLIHDFHKHGVTQIDTGALFEPYVGKAIRKYHAEILNREGRKS